MRKRLIGKESKAVEHELSEWLDLEALAVIELTSEDPERPIEAALASGEGPGWRAQSPGEQLIRFVFDEPQRVRRVRLVFEEPKESRTQEFVLRWATGPDQPTREIVRQQWNFHPHEATREVEVYQTDLSGVRVLELAIQPDVGGARAYASLRAIRVG